MTEAQLAVLINEGKPLDAPRRPPMSTGALWRMATRPAQEGA